jgi:hypothetical protein
LRLGIDLADMGRSVLRPYVFWANVETWVGSSLNPSIWEAIAGTGCVESGFVAGLTEKRRQDAGATWRHRVIVRGV